jgi:hypothetical protein
MSAQLTYRPRAGVVFGIVAGKSVRMRTHQDAARITEWEKLQELRPGKVTLWDHSFEVPRHNVGSARSVPGAARTGPFGKTLKVVENAELETYDYPGRFAQRFDGDDRVSRAPGRLPSHRHRGSVAFVKQPGGGFYLHGPPPCDNPRCIVVIQDWDALFKALKATRQVSFIVEL